MNSPPSSPKRRGRPKTSAKTQPANPAVPEGQHITANVDVLADLVDRVDSKSDLKANMTQRELKFLEIYLTGKHNIDKAMILAGYEGYHPNSLYRLGRKIVQKYEQQAGDHRKIFRAIGAGEIAVAQGLLNLARTPRARWSSSTLGQPWPSASGSPRRSWKVSRASRSSSTLTRAWGTSPGSTGPPRLTRTSPGGTRRRPADNQMRWSSGLGHPIICGNHFSKDFNMLTPIKTIRALCLRCAGRQH